LSIHQRFIAVCLARDQLLLARTAKEIRLMQQKKYQETVEITQGEYEGTYSTDTPERNQAYTYYRDGHRDDEHIHFTVIETGGGNNPLRKFHITLPVVDGTGTANFHVNYFVDYREGVRLDRNIPDNRTEVPSQVRTEALAYLDAHQASLDEVAEEFAAKVWR
jgi:hypothetical protein